MNEPSREVGSGAGEIGTLEYAPRSRGPNVRRWIALAVALAFAGGYVSYQWLRPTPINYIATSRVPVLAPALVNRPAIVATSTTSPAIVLQKGAEAPRR